MYVLTLYNYRNPSQKHELNINCKVESIFIETCQIISMDMYHDLPRLKQSRRFESGKHFWVVMMVNYFSFEVHNNTSVFMFVYLIWLNTTLK